MAKTISVAEFIQAIRRLPADPPRDVPGVWYKTQKEHWLGWLRHYDGPGAYGRIPGQKRDAKFAYNHIVCDQMLLWLIRAAGVSYEQVEAAETAAARSTTLMQSSGAIRKCVPWAEVQKALWGDRGIGIMPLEEQS